jgi:protein involved in polysaccharide export with SLBB domain
MKLLRNIFVSCALSMALLLSGGCATDGQSPNAGPTPYTDPAPAGTNTIAPLDEGLIDNAVIRKGEQLTIELLDIGSPTKIEQIVSEDGAITLPLLSERVPAAGKKERELTDAIRALYVPRYYRRMTINIKRENRYYFVRGQVKNPGQRVYTGDLTVLRAITSAGDFTDYAKKTKIEITRSNGRTQTMNADKARIDPKKDLPLYPGDSVYVPLSILGN